LNGEALDIASIENDTPSSLDVRNQPTRDIRRSRGEMLSLLGVYKNSVKILIDPKKKHIFGNSRIDLIGD
jgi:hypothetical protein